MTVLSAAKDVGRAKTTNTEQLVVRVPPELRERLQALVPKLAPPGVSTTMTDVVRAALVRGVETLEADVGKARGRK
jgi:predicted DNA-binding protein